MKFNVYVGSYVKVKPKMVNNPDIFSMCMKCNVTRHGKFCSECGTEIINKTVDVEEPYELYDILNDKRISKKYTLGSSGEVSDYDDLFLVNDKHSFFDNYKGTQIRNIPEKLSKEFFKDLTDILDEHGLEYTFEYGICAEYEKFSGYGD